MKKTSILLSAVILVAMLGMNVNANAQRNADRKVHAEVHLLGGLPMGNFAKYSTFADNALVMEKKTEGACGFVGGLGIKVTFGLPVNNLSLFVNADALIGSTKSGFRDDYEKINSAPILGVTHSWTTPTYVMVPVMGGARYELNFTEGFGLYGEAGLGLNVMSTTGFTDKYTQSSNSLTETLDGVISASFAFQVGVGFNLGQRVRLGLSYYNLGTNQIKYKYSAEATGSFPLSYTEGQEIKAGKVTPSMFMLNFGFIF